MVKEIDSTETQFFRDLLGQRGADVLADLDLASENGDPSVFVNMEPGR